MFISGGENVYPAEVEGVITGIPGVVDAAVIGMPDPKWGESGLAVVVADGETSLDQDKVVAACLDHLAKYKVPKKVIFSDMLPRTTSGKVMKNRLRDLYIR